MKNTAKIFKEEVSNPAIWGTIVRELGLPPETDEITVMAVSPNKGKENDD